ncbi:MAG TPA: ABC-2 family transporter protein [Ilumatobacter sp.]|nr:ABC-2 family transporter protein [Ilumatobacter sp.]
MSTTAVPPGWVRRHIAFYRAAAAFDLKSSIQYRWPTILGMLALLSEPVVYLVVWTTVADHNGGSVGGLTLGQVSAYYVVWTLVRNLTAGYSPDNWQRRFQDGTLVDLLLRPVHPVHADIAGGFGFNLPRAVISIPLTALLIALFRPDLSPRLLEVGVFAVSIVGAYVLRAVMFCIVGSVGFWTTRVDAAARVYLAIELLLSGRMIPIVLFPGWLASAATWLPFRYTFGFPIEVLTTSMSTEALLAGLAGQIGWTVVAAGALAAIWRVAVRRFDSVGI